MREIKFRWWNGVKMIQNQNLCVLAKNLKSPEHMQFTGLKDKNGKDIYEGDIVTSYKIDGSIEKSGDIEWCMDMWTWCSHGYLSQALGYMGYSFEVIGNIHENPELLERGKQDA